jgi:hypothetical protein
LLLVRYLFKEVVVALRFLGGAPGCDLDNCPAVWLDEAGDVYVLQGWRVVDPATLAEIGDIPEGETVIRIPRHMAKFFTETM